MINNFNMREEVEDYLWTFDFNKIDNKKLYNTCVNVETELRKYFPEPVENNYGCFTSYYHKYFNLFFYPCPELGKLYNYMIKTLPPIIGDGQFYLRCWPNLFAKNKNISWHQHWPSESKAYHGFYCVNTEGAVGSYTEYKIPGCKEVVVIPSKNGKCVFGKSAGDEHRSSEWQNDGYRITIAFDVIPVETLRPMEQFTHEFLTNFIPLGGKINDQ